MVSGRDDQVDDQVGVGCGRVQVEVWCDKVDRWVHVHCMFLFSAFMVCLVTDLVILLLATPSTISVLT